MKTILLPRLGLTMEEGTVVKWHLAEGESFVQGQVIFEVMTDKVTTEVEAPFSGTLRRILVKEDETAPVSAVVAEAD